MTDPTQQAPEYAYFNYDGAFFRRRENGLTQSVDDVLRDRSWVPYVGRDALKPAVFGDPCDDPMATPDATAAPSST